MPAGKPKCGSHDWLGLVSGRLPGTTLTLPPICGEDGWQHVKAQELSLYLFRLLMTSCILESILACRQIDLLYHDFHSCKALQHSRGCCGRDLLPRKSVRRQQRPS